MAKFIVPATYEAQNGHNADGTPKMVQMPYENAGETVTVPDADAEWFEKEKGWKKAGEKIK